MPTVNRGEIEAGIATSNMFKKRVLLSFNFSNLNLAGTDLLKSLMTIMLTIKEELISVAAAAPGTPILGNPYQPKIKPLDRKT